MFDYRKVALGTALLITIIGMVNLWSASKSLLGTRGYYLQQLIWFVIAIGCYYLVAHIEDSNVRRFAPYLFILNLILLVLVLFMAPYSKDLSSFLHYHDLQ